MKSARAKFPMHESEVTRSISHCSSKSCVKHTSMCTFIRLSEDGCVGRREGEDDVNGAQ